MTGRDQAAETMKSPGGSSQPLPPRERTALAVIVPTVGRHSLPDTLSSIAPQVQPGDRVVVVCDYERRFDFCSEAVDFVRQACEPEVTWRCFMAGSRNLGCYGHPARNVALDYLAELSETPGWVWSLDDDDVAVFGALDMIRAACESGQAAWYVFRMRGGTGSHFPGVTVPTMGDRLQTGNVGTPMLVFPAATTSRYGTSELHDSTAGYFGDFEMAKALEAEFGDPAWVASTVCEVRPRDVA